MLKKPITYTDFNGDIRTETFYFNLSEAEIAEMELTTRGGLEAHLKEIVNTNDPAKIVAKFKEIILTAYGEKSEDGRRFIKSDELRQEFTQTNAYSVLFIELATDEKAAAEFMNGVVPDSAKPDPDKPSAPPALPPVQPEQDPEYLAWVAAGRPKNGE